MSRPKFSLILPVRGSQAELDEWLEPVKGFPEDGSWELMVIDDNSREPLALIDTPGQLIRLEKDSGAAISRNAGASRSTGDYLVFLSVFLMLPEDYLQKLTEFVNDHDFDFAQHPLFVQPGDRQDHFQAFIGNQRDRTSTRTENLKIKQSLFGAAVVRRSTFEALGGFDVTMQHYGGHEMDLIYRMEKNGYSRRILIDAIPLKRLKISKHSSVRDKLREYGHTGLPNLLAKHPELKTEILLHGTTWKLFQAPGLTSLMEYVISVLVDSNIKLPHYVYRLYLHLIMRNAWDGR